MPLCRYARVKLRAKTMYFGQKGWGCNTQPPPPPPPPLYSPLGI